MANNKKTKYEALRQRCTDLHQQGYKQTAIAQALGLTQGWVSRTLTIFHQKGQDSLAWRKPAEATGTLTESQLAQLVEELKKGAEYYGFLGHVWTIPRINEVINRLFGISYDTYHVGCLVKKAARFRQKSLPKACKQDPPRVKQRREDRLPELRKSLS